MDAKPQWFASHGWAFASIGFRALPEAPVEDQARDIGRALQTLRQQAGPLGFDPQRLLLLGHSSGAHLTALIATDPSYASGFSCRSLAVIRHDTGCCRPLPR